MNFSVEQNKSKILVNWQDVNADYYKVFVKNKDGVFECAKTEDTLFAQISLVPYGRNEFYVQAFKGDKLIDETKPKTVIFEAVDAYVFENGEKYNFVYSKYRGASGYRLYKNENGFVGCKNSKTETLVIEKPNENLFKIKPFKDDENGRNFLASSEPIFLTKFEFTSLYKSYDGLFLSWNYNGNADGFYVYAQNNDQPIFTTNEYLRHYCTIKNFGENAKFIVKAFINTSKGRMTIAESGVVEIKARNYTHPEISLIIPAYNSENYIARSIDSALANNFDDLEIVIVNDGSKDNTQQILDWYSKNYPNVSVYTKQNGGVADTRNVGIKNAKGKFIAFMDNDDLIRPDMMSILYNAIVENACDIAIAPLYRIIDKGYTVHQVLPFKNNEAIDIDEWLKIAYTPGYYNCAIWNKLYKAELVKSHPLGILKYEDVSWTPCIMSWAKNLVYVSKPLYEWDRKTRPETFGDVLAKQPEDQLFEHRKQAMMFFVNEGNPDKKDFLKALAIRRLKRYSKNSSNNSYNELIDYVNSL